VTQRPEPRYPADHYLNRELSWLEFNARVLEEAQDAATPLLERLKFLAIFSSNLDEFFEVRVAGLQQQVYAGLEPQDYGADGLDAREQLARINERTHQLVEAQYRVLGGEVVPALADQGIRRVTVAELDELERLELEDLFRTSVYPVLTPLAIDPGHPFPHVHNKSLNVALLIEGGANGDVHRMFAVVQVPAVLPRVMFLTSEADRQRFVLLEDLVAAHLGELFRGSRVLAHTVFRVTRNTDLEINEDEAEDLLATIEETLRQRIRGEAVRLEISADADDRFVQLLTEALDLEARDVYRVAGPVDLTALMALHQREGFRALRDEPLLPRVPPAFAAVTGAGAGAGADTGMVAGRDMFEVIRQQDVLVHHPYESFGCVVDFIERAAEDPQVLAIKQTLYRTSGLNPLITALGRAAQRGKQVTALVELKARFDEENNIAWARSLEQAGVHVVYGVAGLKTHCKAALVVRREAEGIRRYVHVSTGNYNATTARSYTDVGLFTARPDYGEDVSEVFNLLTGYSRGYRFRKLLVAPLGLRERILELIDRERRNAEAGRPARIVVKMNALVEPSIIDALYAASQAGVGSDLLIRGICCLRPGMPGVSEHIRVTNVVDKFLEHSRIFYFENGGDPEVFLASADWMPRNFFRRIEIMFPLEDDRLRQRVIEEILPAILADNVKARVLRPDGRYEHVTVADDTSPVRCQVVLQHLAREAARVSADQVRRVIPPLRRPRPEPAAPPGDGHRERVPQPT